MPRISLVICTHNRADVLPRCLVAAHSQTLPPHDYEVIVVDNGSTDATASLVRHMAGIRYVHCAEPGLSHARNSGAQHALSPVIAYIDDDAIADPNLLQALLDVFDRHPRAGAVGGRIRLSLPAQLPRWYSSDFAGYYSAFDLGTDRITRVTELWQYPFGANCAFSSEALRRAGYFSTHLGRVGRDASGGEELDAECRIAQLGYEIYYTPFTAVEHLIFSPRLRWSHISGTAKAAGRNWAYYEAELLGQGTHLAPDIRALAGVTRRMAEMLVRGAGPPFYVAWSQSIFYRAKIGRKIHYKFSA